ncbi:MAG: Na(+)-translocating NADH-quinone reductase subunit A [Bacteroidales bacterium]|nr:Na(+)-translocating NADH-quinone reductase subunit A [Bacteroidales bacterium]
MPPVIKLKRGLDIPIEEDLPKIWAEAPQPHVIALKPSDFKGVTPKLLVKEGDVVVAGAPVYTDKNRPNILFTAPLGGVVSAVVRGEKRKILEIRIDVIPEGAPSGVSAGEPGVLCGDPSTLSRAQIVETLLQTGLWPMLKQRPYGIIANPDDTPKAIFISAFDSAPLAPDLDYILTGQEDDLQRGIDTLHQLAPGNIHWSIPHHTPQTSVLRKVNNVHTHVFKGRHPAGNVGVQIHHIAPISKGEVVWTIDPQSVVIIGRLFGKGKLDFSKIVALTGPAAVRPCYFTMIPGSPLCIIPQIGAFKPKVRYVSGNCLTGDNVGYNGALGFYHHQITLLPERDHPEFLGWVKVFRTKTFSVSRSYLSWLFPKKRYPLDTNTNGGERAFVMADEYAKVLPMDIYPVYLLKAILAGEIEKMEALGIYEVIEEDFALCEFVCPSKIDIQEIIANGIDLMIKEMS